jgi:hypothetical protein
VDSIKTRQEAVSATTPLFFSSAASCCFAIALFFPCRSFAMKQFFAFLSLLGWLRHPQVAAIRCRNNLCLKGKHDPLPLLSAQTKQSLVTDS